MKKFVTILILCIVCAFCAVGFSACGKNEIVVKNATINEDGDLIITYTDDNIVNAGNIVNNENPQELDFCPQDDGTYAIQVGRAKMLSNIVIPSVYKGKPVTSIGNSAFSGCSALTNITIPDSVTSIGDSAFYYCSSLKTVNYTGTIDSWCEINFIGDYANPLSCTKNLYINGELVTAANITNATKINAYAFYNCSALTSVTIGNSVTSIGENAFYGCYNLQYNEYENGLYLGNNDNKYLVLVKAKSTDITSFTIHNDTRFIMNGAFGWCSSLTSIIIGDRVTSIGWGAFYYCSALTSITYQGTIEQWQAISKGDSWNAYIPSNCVIHCTDGDAEI